MSAAVTVRLMLNWSSSALTEEKLNIQANIAKISANTARYFNDDAIC